MTGYGRATVVSGGVTATAEIRSVNHRYFDVRIRMPQGLLALEDSVRRAAQAQLQRGRVEITVTVEDSEQQSRTVNVDRGLLAQARQVLEEARQALGVTDGPKISDLALIPDLFRMDEWEADPEACRPAVDEAVRQALGDVVRMRRAEGQALAEDIASRVDRVQQLLEAAVQRAPDVVRDLQDRLRRRVADLVGEVTIDDGRIEAEVAMLADRIDVSEETARIASHISQLRTLLGGGGPVGRTLDFLLQELNREWNTIGSKANDALIAQMVVDARAELEKIREQVQNIE